MHGFSAAIALPRLFGGVMYKLGHEVDGEVVEHSHPARFIRQTVAPGEPGRSRLTIGVPGGDPAVLAALA